MPECKKVFDFVKNVKVIEDTNQRSKEKINLNAKVYDLEKQKRLLESRLKNILTNFNLSNIQVYVDDNVRRPFFEILNSKNRK